MSPIEIFITIVLTLTVIKIIVSYAKIGRVEDFSNEKIKTQVLEENYRNKRKGNSYTIALIVISIIIFLLNLNNIT